MKIVITGFVHLVSKDAWEADDAQRKFTFFGFNASETNMGYTVVGPASLEYELPEGWNPVAAEIAALEDQKIAALDKYHKSVISINERLSKLQALTNYSAPAAPDASA